MGAPEHLDRPTCQQVIDLLPEPFVVIDRDYRIVAANRAYRRRYGLRRGEVEGRRCHEVSHRSPVPCSRHGEVCPLEMALASRGPAQALHVHYDADGRADRVELEVMPILDGGCVRFFGERIRPLSERAVAGELLVGRSPSMLRVLALLQRAARSEAAVLLSGEGGTGKEQAARYLHHHSRRADGPFVVADCAALGPAGIEEALAGDPAPGRGGLLEAARGGTLFIDEVAELPPGAQARLLRALEGGRADVRVVAATRRDLVACVERGRLRADLYYRLGAFPVEMPALREHIDDVPALAEHFVAAMDGGGRHLPLAPEVLERLMSYHYPGNVRELRHIVERAVVLAGDGPLRPRHVVFPAEPQAVQPLRRRGRPAGGTVGREAVLAALARAGGHRGRAAAYLGVSERTLYRYLRRLREGAG
ncbi:sigma 54-interacting transcriptional regulator [Inmirania thermothiophila]|uniref:Transcriptional regulator with PAS, ATPase and Fis domain n=1 Tax=Inmirania thermothiophila TaxID=1750597 RepID=A0A3N1Y1G2_9GAMM|nr:sigma 54-interacting transcriptional regulator [Inmirania thermothiophila]ROR32674.1 transcriptional regulator with PAS, ATPase and Fis domain [Inmirania thermothiophila]